MSKEDQEKFDINLQAPIPGIGVDKHNPGIWSEDSMSNAFMSAMSGLS